MPRRPSRARLLRVHTVEAGPGRRAGATVRCPKTGERVYIDEGADCGFCAGIALAPDGKGLLRCEWKSNGAEEPPPLEQTVRQASRRTPVASIMSRALAVAHRDTPLGPILDVMLARDIGGVPVIDEEGHPIGMLSKADVLRQQGDGGPADGERLSWPSEDVDAPEDELSVVGPTPTAADAMTPIVIAVPEAAPIAFASALMASEGVDRVAVVDRGGRLAGIVSSNDVMRWLARRSGYAIG